MPVRILLKMQESVIYHKGIFINPVPKWSKRIIVLENYALMITH